MGTKGVIAAAALTAAALTAGVAATSTGALGGFNAAINNQGNVIQGTDLSFTQTVIDTYQTTATQTAGTTVRVSNGTENGQYTALDVPVFPPLSIAADLQPVTVALKLQNTGTSNAIITARYENLTFTQNGQPLPVQLDAAAVAGVMGVHVDGKVSDSDLPEHTTTTTESLGVLAAGQAIPFNDEANNTPLVIAPEQSIIVQLTHTVNTADLDALGPEYSGVGGGVDVVFEMNQTIAEPTITP